MPPARRAKLNSNMRIILCWAALVVLAAPGWSADDPTTAKKAATAPRKTAAKSPASAHKAPAKKGATKSSASATRKKASPSKTGVSKGTAASAAKAGPRTTTSAARRGKKGPPAKRVTWRNRQLAPTPERYKEIQEALAAKGYLNPDDASGAWNQASVDALKKFQAAQNIDSNGKINSLSLIALGLGPRRETAPPKPPAASPPAPQQ